MKSDLVKKGYHPAKCDLNGIETGLPNYNIVPYGITMSVCSLVHPKRLNETSQLYESKIQFVPPMDLGERLPYKIDRGDSRKFFERNS